MGWRGWLKDDYLVFGDDIKPLAKELGLYIATVSTQTLHVREEASTDSAIVGPGCRGRLLSCTGVRKLDGSKSSFLLTPPVTFLLIMSQSASSQDAQSALRLRWQRWRRHDRLLKKLSRHPEPPRKPRLQPQNRRQKQTRLKVPPGLRENLEILRKSTAAPAAKSSYVISASESDVYLLSACLTMEANGGSYESYLAVGSPIVNRVKSGKWGKSISSVIYADGQFPGATSGLLDKYLDRGPSSTATKAAKAALAGENR